MPDPEPVEPVASDGAAPPLPSLVRAAEAVGSSGAGTVIPLSVHEQDRCCGIVDLALGFSGSSRVDARRLVEALGRTLTHFPPCAGRFVRRDVQPEGSYDKGVRFCILCNDVGMAFRFRDMHSSLMPPMVGPLPPGLFDRALGVQPRPDGGLGGPLLRMQLLNYGDGQLLALSFARGLTDVVGLNHFLQCLVCLYRGEGPGPRPMLDRVALELAIRWKQPRLASEFVKLHHIEAPNPSVAAKELLVWSLLLRSDELHSMVTSISEHCRKKFLIYDSETLSEDEVALAMVVQSLRTALIASMSFDYRETFGFGPLFGSANELIDLPLPCDLAGIAAALRKLPLIADNRDFWSWKATQPFHSLEGRLVLDSWVRSLDLASLSFTGEQPRAVGLSTAFWQDCMAAPEACGSCYVVAMPHAEGVLVQALLPRAAIIRLSKDRNDFVTWRP